MLIQTPFRYFNPAWTTQGGAQHLMLLLLQFYNTMEVYYMPVYSPSELERNDPILFANNVRQEMADLGNVPVSEYDWKEYIRRVKEAKALKHGRTEPQAAVAVAPVSAPGTVLPLPSNDIQETGPVEDFTNERKELGHHASVHSTSIVAFEELSVFDSARLDHSSRQMSTRELSIRDTESSKLRSVKESGECGGLPGSAM
jgi:hypothetical protein